MIELDIRARAGAFTLACALSVETPGIISVFGPSGAGKTTLLRVIAGLATPETGRMRLDGENILEVTPEARRIGYVFQDGRLFPHLTVRGNLLYGYTRAAEEERRLHLEEIVEALGIFALLDRGVRALSGGERQRVALGRALLAQPRLLLMDEPLASVDAVRKGEILSLIRRVQARFALTILHVCHDLDEVAALADHVVLMRSGRVLMQAGALALLADPDGPLSERPDARAFIDGRIAEQQDGLTIVQAGDARLVAPMHEGAAPDPVRLQVFARDVTLALQPPQAISTRNILPAEIVSLRVRADGQALVALRTAAGPLLSIVTQDAVRDLALRAGLSLYALVKAVAVK